MLSCGIRGDVLTPAKVVTICQIADEKLGQHVPSPPVVILFLIQVLAPFIFTDVGPELRVLQQFEVVKCMWIPKRCRR